MDTSHAVVLPEKKEKNTLHVGQPRVHAKKEARAKVGAKKKMKLTERLLKEQIAKERLNSYKWKKLKNPRRWIIKEDDAKRKEGYKSNYPTQMKSSNRDWKDSQKNHDSEELTPEMKLKKHSCALS